MTRPDTPRRSTAAALLTDRQIGATAEAMAAQQLPDGRLPWHVDDHTDPWNHVEGAMGLDVAGCHAEAEAAYEWLVASQRPDGSWASYFHYDGSVKDPNVDPNICAYVAVGVWHHYLITGDQGFLRAMWPVVERAIDMVLDLQSPNGEIWWTRHPDGWVDERALLTANSSIHMSLRCAVALAEELGEERPDWELSIGMVAHAVRYRPEAFWPKERWAMDWYYPVLCGIVRGDDAAKHLAGRWDTFVVADRGCRCVSDSNWVTAAETCELVMALDNAGEHDAAVRLFEDVQFLRQDDGAYQEGWVFPDDVHWPGRRPPWTAGAVLLAADALSGLTPAAGLFRGEGLPTGIAPEDAFDAAPPDTGNALAGEA
jgi:hypothetical protein